MGFCVKREMTIYLSVSVKKHFILPSRVIFGLAWLVIPLQKLALALKWLIIAPHRHSNRLLAAVIYSTPYIAFNTECTHVYVTESQAIFHVEELLYDLVCIVFSYLIGVGRLDELLHICSECVVWYFNYFIYKSRQGQQPTVQSRMTYVCIHAHDMCVHKSLSYSTIPRTYTISSNLYSLENARTYSNLHSLCKIDTFPCCICHTSDCSVLNIPINSFSNNYSI
jgi:hypothetical protein